MKKQYLLLLGTLLLCACNSETGLSGQISTSINQTSTNPTSATSSQKEGLYTKMNRAFTRLANSFTAEGQLSTFATDGTVQEQDFYNCIIEVDKDSYYYAEREISTGEKTVEENYFRGEDDMVYARTLNLATNEVMEQKGTVLYNAAIRNGFDTIVVKDLNGIQGRPNWYELKYNVGNALSQFLTGYTMECVQFAVHFDGDNFDQFRILLEYYVEEGEDYFYGEQMLFELNISNYEETTPRKISAFEKDSTHDALQTKIDEIAAADNYTLEFKYNYKNTSLKDYAYAYSIDMKNEMMLSSEVRQTSKYDETVDDYVPYEYNFGYKTKEVNGVEEFYMYYFDPTTREVIVEEDYNKYAGTTAENKRNFYYMAPKMGLIAAECYKPLGNNSFTTYAMTYQYIILSLLPYNEAFNYDDIKVKIENGTLKGEINTSVKIMPDNSSQVISSDLTILFSFTNINNTTIDNCLVNA